MGASTSSADDESSELDAAEYSYWAPVLQDGAVQLSYAEYARMPWPQYASFQRAAHWFRRKQAEANERERRDAERLARGDGADALGYDELPTYTPSDDEPIWSWEDLGEHREDLEREGIIRPLGENELAEHDDHLLQRMETEIAEVRRWPEKAIRKHAEIVGVKADGDIETLRERIVEQIRDRYERVT